MRGGWWLLVLLTGACGERTLPAGAAADGGVDGPTIVDVPPIVDGAVAALEARSGSRLKARWSVAPDGRRVFLGWFDSRMNVDCAFGRAADGLYHCLPGQLGAALPAYYFADPACTQPAVLVGRTVPTFATTACGPASFITRYDFMTCNLGIRVFQVGAEITGQTFSKLGGGCRAAFPQPGTTAFTVGPEVPLDSFVRATVEGVPVSTGGSLQPTVFAADDGARQPFGWQDASDRAACRILRLGDGALHCVTRSAAVSTVSFSDTACTQPALATSNCGPVPRYAYATEAGRCPEVHTVRTVGDRLATYQYGLDGTCTPRSGANTLVYAVGAEAPPQSFAPFDVSDETTGQLRRRGQSLAGQPSLLTGWVDADRNTPCRAIRFGDKVRCAPVPVAGDAIAYADAACTTPLGLFQGRCPDAYTFNVDESSCPVRLRIFAVGARSTGPVFVRGLDSTVDPARITCSPYTPQPTDAVHELTPVPETDLPELTIVVD
jgi:hypothetical protein